MIKEKVTLHPLNIVESDKGNIRHILNKNEEGFNSFGEVYISEINPLNIKGWTLHKNKTSNLVVVKGHVKFVFVESSNPDKFIVHELSTIENNPGSYARICMRPNVWFAFQGLHCKVSRVLNISNVVHNETLSIKKNLDYFDYKWNKS